jgi:NAD-dependent DNA ligase
MGGIYLQKKEACMASERVSMILRSETTLTEDQIKSMSDKEGWNIIYKLKPKKTKPKKTKLQICFTGFDPHSRNKLEEIAVANEFEVVKSITKGLKYLCAGPNAGPSKIEKAKKQNRDIISLNDFHQIILAKVDI